MIKTTKTEHAMVHKPWSGQLMKTGGKMAWKCELVRFSHLRLSLKHSVNYNCKYGLSKIIFKLR